MNLPPDHFQTMRRHVPGERILVRPAATVDQVDLEVMVRERVPESTVLPAGPDPVLAWVVEGSAMVDMRSADGKIDSVAMVPGDFYLSNGALPTAIGWRTTSDTPFTTMHVYLRPQLRAHAAQDVARNGAGFPVLRSAIGERDEILSALLKMLYMAFSRPEHSCPGVMQGISQALAAHVVRCYAGPTTKRAAAIGGLPAYKLNRVFHAMRDHLTDPFDLRQFACKADLSVYHFSRAFKQATGVTPSRYFLKLRVEEAKRMLCDTRHGIIDVAYALGYRSPSHFSQVFRQLTGMSPSTYRNCQ